jgi:hypothetical protein
MTSGINIEIKHNTCTLAASAHCLACQPAAAAAPGPPSAAVLKATAAPAPQATAWLKLRKRCCRRLQINSSTAAAVQQARTLSYICDMCHALGCSMVSRPPIVQSQCSGRDPTLLRAAADWFAVLQSCVNSHRARRPVTLHVSNKVAILIQGTQNQPGCRPLPADLLCCSAASTATTPPSSCLCVTNAARSAAMTLCPQLWPSCCRALRKDDPGASRPLVSALSALWQHKQPKVRYLRGSEVGLE